MTFRSGPPISQRWASNRRSSPKARWPQPQSSRCSDSAVVLVVASERVTNAAGAKDEPREFRLRVTVSPDGDQLKMSKVEFVL